MKKTLLLAVCLVLALHCGEAAVSCGMAVMEFYPCLSFVSQGGTSVPDSCCDGLRTLNSLSQTPEDRQTVCSCIKSAIEGVSDSFNNPYYNALYLASICRVNFPYTFSPTTDCGSIG